MKPSRFAAFYTTVGPTCCLVCRCLMVTQRKRAVQPQPKKVREIGRKKKRLNIRPPLSKTLRASAAQFVSTNKFIPKVQAAFQLIPLESQSRRTSMNLKLVAEGRNCSRALVVREYANTRWVSGSGCSVFSHLHPHPSSHV